MFAGTLAGILHAANLDSANGWQLALSRYHLPMGWTLQNSHGQCPLNDQSSTIFSEVISHSCIHNQHL